jgi:hypothetical protein
LQAPVPLQAARDIHYQAIVLSRMFPGNLASEVLSARRTPRLALRRAVAAALP